jgi:integrase
MYPNNILNIGIQGTEMKRCNIKRRPLADTVLEALEPEENEYREKDSHNLYFRVQPSGKKSWQLRYKNSENKWTWLGLGAYPAVSAVKAREKAMETILRKSNGEEIKTKKDIIKEKIDIEELKFKYLLRDWLGTRKKRWNEVTFNKAVKSLEKHIFPNFSERNFNEISPKDWLDFFSGLQQNFEIYNQVEKLTSYCRGAYDLAKFQNRVTSNPLDRINEYLDPYKKGNMNFVTYDELPELIFKIRQYPVREIAIGLELLILMFPRPSELRFATWDQFDFNKAIWVRPASIMKNNISHAIPLSKQAICLLQELKENSDISNLLFPGRNSFTKPISDNTFNMALKRLGYEGKQDPHGFRHIASTQLNKKFSEKPQVVESTLSHLKKGVKGIYDKEAHYEERIGMMQWWADELDMICNLKS